MHKNIADLSDKDILKILRKESPELLVMLPDIEKRLESMDKDIKPYADALHRTPPSLHSTPLSPTGEALVDSTVQVKLSYMMLLLNYLILKAEHGDMKTHPLTSLLVKARWARRRSVRRRAMSDQTDKLQTKLKRAAVAKVEEEKKEEEEEEKPEEEVEEEEEEVPAVDDEAMRCVWRAVVRCREEEEAFSLLPSRASQKRKEKALEEERALEEEEEEPRVEKKPRFEDGEDDFYKEAVARKKKKAEAKEERKQYQELYVNDDYVLGEGESRKATKKILANRGLVASRPKVNRNPRVKKRRQYEKALRHRHGQVASMRTNEADQYGGEKSGIRADVTHSRVFG